MKPEQGDKSTQIIEKEKSYIKSLEERLEEQIWFKYRLDFSELDLGKELQQGGRARIYKGKWLKRGGGVTVAIKEIFFPKRFDLKAELEEFRKHVSLLHPNVLPMYGFAATANRLYLIMEFMPEGSLEAYFQRRTREGNHMTTLEKVNMMIQMAMGLNYVHGCGFIHRDVRCKNFLSDRDGGIVKICDMDILRKMDPTAEFVISREKGTFIINPPEIIGKRHKAVFSFDGLTLWEFFYEKVPFREELASTYKDKGLVTLQNDIIEIDLRPKFDDTIPTELKELIELCWHKDREKRCSAIDVIKVLSELKEKLTEKKD